MFTVGILALTRNDHNYLLKRKTRHSASCGTIWLRKVEETFRDPASLVKSTESFKTLRCGLSSGVCLCICDVTTKIIKTFILFYFSNDQTSVAASRRLDFEAIKHVCCISIDTTAVRILQMEICAHFNTFASVASVLTEQPYGFCR